MNTQALLEEVYKSAFENELEKLGVADLITAPLRVGGAALKTLKEVIAPDALRKAQKIIGKHNPKEMAEKIIKLIKRKK